MVLSILKENTPAVGKYIQIAKLLEKQEGSKVISKLFVSSSHTTSLDIRSSTNRLFTDVEEADFSKNDNAFTTYVNKYGRLRSHEFSSKTEFVLANISLFEGSWQSNVGAGIVTKLYNSFNYTQDVKYEGRLLELPLSSELKLVVILPNEADVLHTLFSTLTDRGLAAAVNSIQPLFTAKTKLEAPNIEINSRVEFTGHIGAISKGPAVQYGDMVVSDKGTRVRVLTCVYSPTTAMVKTDDQVTSPGKTQTPFYFAVVYNDTPIFIGNFNKQLL